jgi:organic radical activating enzyme
MAALAAIPRYKTLSIMPTQRCTAECIHCGTMSSPRERAALSRDAVLKVIDEAAGLDEYKLVVFTGGEPTLAWPTLLAGITRAHERGLTTRVVTNAHWARSAEAARRRVRALRSAGLDEINFSTGDQHARFVPVERVVQAIRAACENGITSIAVMVEKVAARGITRQSLCDRPDYRQLSEDYPGVVVQVNESPWMPLSEILIGRYAEGTTTNRSNLAERTGCDSVLATTTVQPDGQITACCGLGVRMIPELAVGDITDTTLAAADKDAAEDFLKRWIRVEGPERILDWASRYDPAIEWEDRYAHRCQACLRLYRDPAVRRVILEHHQDKRADVLVAEWLLHHYRDDPPESADPAASGP